MVTTWHQEVFALDAKYNAKQNKNQPGLGMLYIRRRSQLLREKPFKNPEIRSQYLKIRFKLLCQRYGDSIDDGNSHLFDRRDNETRTRNFHRKSTAENFAFTGVHHVFDQHNASISMLKYGNNDRSKLCCASMDGTLSICETINPPLRVVALLEGHKQGVTAFDWSISNDLIVSSSLDRTIRLWKVDVNYQTSCLRVVQDQQSAELLCCAFIPANNNLVVAGNSLGLLQILNVSTGKYARGGSCKLGGKILSLTCEESGGSLIWVGTDRGIIISLKLEPGTGRLSKLKHVQDTGGMVTSLSWRCWLAKDTPWPALLVNSANDLVLLYRVMDAQGSLFLWRQYKIKHRQYMVKSTFCPQMGACLIATGSEDGVVHLFDSTREGKAASVNKLQGHAAPALVLSFNYDESLLASADYQGLIILWRNNQRNL